MSAPTFAPHWLDEYDALENRAGVVDLGHRTQIEIGGRDRASFLHNLCTNEIRKLPVGQGCEVFLSSVQGKTLAHAFVFAQAETLVLDTVPGEAEKILAHLDHYLVCEEVTLADRSLEWTEFLIAGKDGRRVLSQLGLQTPDVRMSCQPATVAGHNVSVRRVNMVDQGDFLVSVASQDVVAVREAIHSAGASECGSAPFEAARIEWGFPLFGIDITDKNLPQEVARDSQAISFVKGCYLGQETVARIDALGHVNKSLVTLRFDGTEMPVSGLDLVAADQVVGQVTSSTYSPRFKSALALGYVRRGSNAPGTPLTSACGNTQVIASGWSSSP